jgi:hypothetical protein
MIIYSRTDGDDSGEDSYKLTMLDKVLVSTVWFVGLVNTLLSEYIVSKNPHTLCSIRESIVNDLMKSFNFFLSVFSNLFRNRSKLFFCLCVYVIKKQYEQNENNDY